MVFGDVLDDISLAGDSTTYCCTLRYAQKDYLPEKRKGSPIAKEFITKSVGANSC